MKYRGHTHLMVALEEGRTEIAKSLLQHGVFILPEQVLISYPYHFHGNIPHAVMITILFSGSTGVNSSAHCMQKWQDRHGRADSPGCREAGHDSDFSFWAIRQVSRQHADTPQHGRIWGRAELVSSACSPLFFLWKQVSCPLASLFYACWLKWCSACE